MPAIQDILQLFLTICNSCVMIYIFIKFINRPRTDLEQRVTILEVKQKEMEQSLKDGNDRFRHQDQTNATFKSVMLSFINFEIAYCMHTGYEHNQDLLNAKKELEEYLTGNRHDTNQ